MSGTYILLPGTKQNKNRQQELRYVSEYDVNVWNIITLLLVFSMNCTNRKSIRKSRRTLLPVRVSHQLTPQHDILYIRHDVTPQHQPCWLGCYHPRRHTTTSAMLAWLLPLLLLMLATSQRDTSVPTPVSSTYQHPMAAVRGINARPCHHAGYDRPDIHII